MASPFSWFNNLCLVTCLFLEATVSQVAIAWLLHRPTVASVVIGARTTKQLEENMKAVNQARFFTEARLLQRDIKVLVEGVTNQNMVATIIHPVSTNLSFLYFVLV